MRGAVLAGALVPDGDVRCDTGLDQPAEELARAVGSVGDEARVGEIWVREGGVENDALDNSGYCPLS